MCFSRVDSLDNSVIWSTLSGQSIHRIKLCFNVAGQKLVETAPLSPTAGVSTLLFCSSPVQCCKVSCPANGLHHLNNSFLIQHVALRRTCWLASLQLKLHLAGRLASDYTIFWGCTQVSGQPHHFKGEKLPTAALLKWNPKPGSLVCNQQLHVFFSTCSR